MNVLSFIYTLILMLEFVMNIFILHKMYPALGKNTKLTKGMLAIIGVILLFLHIYNNVHSYISNIYVVALSIEMAAIYSIFFRAKFRVVLIWEMLYGNNLAFLKLPVLIYEGIVENKTLGQVNRDIISLEEIVWSFLVNILFLVAIWKGKAWWDMLCTYVKKKNRYLLLIVILQWSLLTYNMLLGQKGFQTADLVINVVFIICTVLAIQYFLLYMSYQKVKSKNGMMDMTQHLTQNHNYALEELYNNNIKKLHDVKHYMLCIAGCLEQQDIEGAKKQVNNYLGDLNKAQYQVWTGSNFLDFIISYKKAEMDERGIEFQFQFELFDFPLEEAEMGVVLGNLLDNAIEAAEQCEAGNRKICMVMRTANQVNILHIKNNCSVRPQQVKGKFVTSKKNKEAHGLGVESVKRIVEKHGGSIEFQYDSEQFEVTILL